MYFTLNYQSKELTFYILYDNFWTVNYVFGSHRTESLKGYKNADIFYMFSQFAPFSSVHGANPGLSAPRPRLWLDRDANAVFHHPLFKSLSMFDPQFLFQISRILRSLSYKQPDLSKPKNRQKARDSAEKKVIPVRQRNVFFRIFLRLFG